MALVMQSGSQPQLQRNASALSALAHFLILKNGSRAVRALCGGQAPRQAAGGIMPGRRTRHHHPGAGAGGLPYEHATASPGFRGLAPELGSAVGQTPYGMVRGGPRLRLMSVGRFPAPAVCLSSHPLSCTYLTIPAHMPRHPSTDGTAAAAAAISHRLVVHVQQHPHGCAFASSQRGRHDGLRRWNAFLWRRRPRKQGHGPVSTRDNGWHYYCASSGSSHHLLLFAAQAAAASLLRRLTAEAHLRRPGVCTAVRAAMPVAHTRARHQPRPQPRRLAERRLLLQVRTNCTAVGGCQCHLERAATRSCDRTTPPTNDAPCLTLK